MNGDRIFSDEVSTAGLTSSSIPKFKEMNTC
jgi:hypothetical protein